MIRCRGRRDSRDYRGGSGGDEERSIRSGKTASGRTSRDHLRPIDTILCTSWIIVTLRFWARMLTIVYF